MMNNDKGERRRISRRMVLTGTGLALSAAAAATALSQATAQQKISQALANYQGKPKGSQHCALCVNFQAPKSCKFVLGDISPNGWCQLFSQKT